MKKEQITFTLFFGNRGFFPGELIAGARKEMIQVLEENVKNTQIVVEMAHAKGVSVEAEIGVMVRKETVSFDEVVPEMTPDMYTDPAQADEFVRLTNVDALACSAGNIHGIYAAKPQLDYERIDTIKKIVGIPLVMHGGSGIDREGYERK